jgi:hypothetical protein
MCSHPDCKEYLVFEASENDPVTVGEAAHIVARSRNGPRGEFRTPGQPVHTYDNLILLCSHHHTVIDRAHECYSVEQLHSWKAEHEAWVRASTHHAPEPLPWNMIFHEDADCRIDAADAASALGAGNAPTRSLALTDAVERDGWRAAAAAHARSVESLVAGTPPDQRRFAIFSLGRIPLAVQLGYVLNDRARVQLYQYDRDRATWHWPAANAPSGLTLRESTPRRSTNPAASLRVSLSAPVSRDLVPPAALDLEIATPAPSVRWLRAAEQLTELARLYETALAGLRARGCTRVHLYYAGPAAGAIAFGRAYNPRMNPPLELYEYRHDATPRYEPVFTLNGSLR